MPFQKGTAQVVCYVAWDFGANVGKTGDSANHTLKIILDGSESFPASAPAEVDPTNCPGLYKVALFASETNFNIIVLTGKSSSSGVAIIPVELTTY